MNVLVDTHVLLWLFSDPARVDPVALAVLSDPENSLWVSAASAWEIAIKTRIGRLDGEPVLAAWPDILATMSIDELAINSADAILAGRLPRPHKDPFDRVIVAQAVRRNLMIATRDTQMIGAALTAVLEA